MSKLSPALKALIAAPHAKPGPAPASKGIERVYRQIALEAAAYKLGQPTWVTLCTAATVTRNSPDALSQLYSFASSLDPSSPSSSSHSSPSSNPTPASSQSHPSAHALRTAELIREVSLKAICFNGVPRTINMLNAFHSSLPPFITSLLRKTPSRTISPANTALIASAGKRLWDSVYLGFAEKLYNKLGEAHPDLPVHILFNEYGALLADWADADTTEKGAGTGTGEGGGGEREGRVGRVLTSVAAVACLRAQTGVGPQVTSHVFGLRKAWDDGSWRGDGEGEEGVRFLASDEGGLWVLGATDRICGSLDGEGEIRAKL